MATLLTTGRTVVTAGETPNFTADLYDTDGTALTKSAITSLTLTIKDCAGDVINSRNAVNINDTGIGSLEDVVVDGVTVVRLTVKPVAADTAFQANHGTKEVHRWEIKWGWTDGDGDARIGGEIYDINVERVAA